MDFDDAIQSLADNLLVYFAARPEAADCATNIQRWWLPQLRVEANVEDVERALSWLAERGEISRRDLADGRTLYGRGWH